MKKSKILIRTAGGSTKGKQLGMGHIFRSIHLAKELKSFQLIFLLEDFVNFWKKVEKVLVKKV